MVLFNLLLLLALLLACLCTLWHCLAAVVGVCCLSCLAGQSPPEPLWGGGVGFMAQVSWPSIAFLSTTPVIASLPTIRIVTDCGPATLLHNWGRVPKELLTINSWKLKSSNWQYISIWGTTGRCCGWVEYLSFFLWLRFTSYERDCDCGFTSCDRDGGKVGVYN